MVQHGGSLSAKWVYQNGNKLDDDFQHCPNGDGNADRTFVGFCISLLYRCDGIVCPDQRCSDDCAGLGIKPRKGGADPRDF